MISRDELKEYEFHRSIRNIVVPGWDEHFIPSSLPPSEKLPFIPL